MTLEFDNPVPRRPGRAAKRRRRGARRRALIIASSGPRARRKRWTSCATRMSISSSPTRIAATPMSSGFCRGFVSRTLTSCAFCWSGKPAPCRSAMPSRASAAYQYLTKPLQADQVCLVVKRALETRELARRHRLARARTEDWRGFLAVSRETRPSRAGRAPPPSSGSSMRARRCRNCAISRGRPHGRNCRF